MDEIEHLLQAGGESQALGRLRNAYSSLLLAHQRLVGLGRRVDRSYCEAEGGSGSWGANDDYGEGDVDVYDREGGAGEGSLSSMRSASNNTTTAAAAASTTTTTFLPPLVSQPPLPPALTQHGDYADVAYVEHLARSGMELHHRRTGRGMQHEAAIERAVVAARMRRMEEEQIVRAARGVCALSDGGPSRGGPAGGDGGGGIPAGTTGATGTPGTTGTGAGAAATAGTGVGRKRRGGVDDGGEDDDDDGDDDDRDELDSGGGGGGGGTANGGDGGGGDGEGELTPSKRKGGRGKKPPTLVMHTMAGRNLDVRELMRGIM